MSKVKRQVRRMWWDIKDIAFFGTNISRKNGMFMSMANSIPVGSIYDMDKNFFGNFTDQNLVFTQESLVKNYANFPKIINDSVKASTSFELDVVQNTDFNVFANILESVQITNISAELETLIKKARNVTVDIKSWGVDYIEEGELAVFLTEMANQNDPRIQQIIDGDNYVATRGIWIKGITLKSNMDEETMAKIKAIAEVKKIDLADAKIGLNTDSSNHLDINLDFDKKFYPFFKFRSIKFEKSEDYYLIAKNQSQEKDVILDDVNFSEFTV